MRLPELVRQIEDSFNCLDGAKTGYMEFPIAWTETGYPSNYKAVRFHSIHIATEVGNEKALITVVSDLFKRLHSSIDWLTYEQKKDESKEVLFWRNYPTFSYEEKPKNPERPLVDLYLRVGFWNQKLEELLTESPYVKAQGADPRVI